MTEAEYRLVKAAWAARERAYAPYSNYCVGAAIETQDGEIFGGCNVENASYAVTICAERTAIVKAVSQGVLKPGGLRAVAVAVDADKPAMPCGICRQTIEEFGSRDTQILISNKPDIIVHQCSQADLLPFAFGPSNLN